VPKPFIAFQLEIRSSYAVLGIFLSANPIDSLKEGDMIKKGRRLSVLVHFSLFNCYWNFRMD